MMEEPPKSSRLEAILLGGAGIFLGLCAALVCCLTGLGFLDRFHLPSGLYLAGAALLFAGPLFLLLRARRRPPFLIGLVIGLSLAGLLLGACGTLMR